ncbi:MAG: hypothetical protein M3O15_12460, partial [Acidobacteriota bacterium]|nr:hypothetical protein [Acidobacteriota bacterium]
MEMKKSSRVQLTLLAAVAAAVGADGCSRAADPCRPESFNGPACQQAVEHHGYRSYGGWVPMTYSRPYGAYYAGWAAWSGRSGGPGRSGVSSESVSRG